MNAPKRGKFTVKTYQSELYTWSPDTTLNKPSNGNKVVNNFCNAIAFSQGQDWVTTYVYSIAVVNGVQQRLAYVACDYVQ